MVTEHASEPGEAQVVRDLQPVNFCLYVFVQTEVDRKEALVANSQCPAEHLEPDWQDVNDAVAHGNFIYSEVSNLSESSSCVEDLI